MTTGESKNASTIRVQLAEVPADVLVHLVDCGGCQRTHTIVAAVSPADAYEPESSVRSALSLLVQLGYAESTYNDLGDVSWYATDAGKSAVESARGQVGTK